MLSLSPSRGSPVIKLHCRRIGNCPSCAHLQGQEVEKKDRNEVLLATNGKQWQVCRDETVHQRDKKQAGKVIRVWRTPCVETKTPIELLFWSS